MSAKKQFALMHIEAIEKGKSTGFMFGYKIAMEYKDRIISVRISGNPEGTSKSEIEAIVRNGLLFSAPVEKRETSLSSIELISQRSEVFATRYSS